MVYKSLPNPLYEKNREQTTDGRGIHAKKSWNRNLGMERGIMNIIRYKKGSASSIAKEVPCTSGKRNRIWK